MKITKYQRFLCDFTDFWGLGGGFSTLLLTFGLWDVIFGRRKRDVGYGMWLEASWGQFWGSWVDEMSDDSLRLLGIPLNSFKILQIPSNPFKFLQIPFKFFIFHPPSPADPLPTRRASGTIIHHSSSSIRVRKVRCTPVRGAPWTFLQRAVLPLLSYAYEMPLPRPTPHSPRPPPHGSAHFDPYNTGGPGAEACWFFFLLQIHLFWCLVDFQELQNQNQILNWDLRMGRHKNVLEFSTWNDYWQFFQLNMVVLIFHLWQKMSRLMLTQLE